MSPLTSGPAYALPVKSRIWPESAASSIVSIALFHSSSVASAGSAPCIFRTSETSSYMSPRNVTLPLYLGSNRSSIESISGARSVLMMIPVKPLCHGTEKSRFGSKSGLSRLGSRFSSTFGIADLS